LIALLLAHAHLLFDAGEMIGVVLDHFRNFLKQRQGRVVIAGVEGVGGGQFKLVGRGRGLGGRRRSRGETHREHHQGKHKPHVR
jgi:hypothetical protein